MKTLSSVWRLMCFPGGSDSKESSCNTGDLHSILRSGRVPGISKWLPNPIFLPGDLHGQRSLEGYSPQGSKKWDTGVWHSKANISMANNRESLGFPGGSVSKESACNVGILGLIPGAGRSPGGGMATHSSILSWRIPRTEEPGMLYSPWGHKESGTSRKSLLIDSLEFMQWQ